MNALHAIVFILLVLLTVIILYLLLASSDEKKWEDMLFYEKVRYQGINPHPYMHILADKFLAKDIVKRRCPKISVAKLYYRKSVV